MDQMGLIGLNILCHNTLFLLPIVGFIFLTFVPGYLMLRIIKIHGIEWGKSLVYAVGLSLAFDTMIVLFVNLVFQWLSISKPISIIPISISLCIFTIILMIIAYITDNTYVNSSELITAKTSKLHYIILISLPSIAIVGALIARFYENSFLLIIFFILVTIVLILVSFDKIINERVYPLLLFAISASLLLHISLSSSQLLGSDIHLEQYFQKITMHNGYWNPESNGILNTALSIMILNPIYNLMLNIDSIWTFKISFIMIFAFVPLVLFYVYKNLVKTKEAFFSSILIIITPMFITSEIGGARNQIGLLYFALILLLMVDSELEQSKKSVLALIFAAALPLSHYGMAAIFIVFLLLGWFIYGILQYCEKKKIMENIKSKFNFAFRSLSERNSNLETFYGFHANFVKFYLIITISWFMYIAAGGVFRVVTYNIAYKTFLQMTEIFSNEYLEPLGAAAIGLDLGEVSVVGKAFRLFQYAIQMLIVVGLLRIILEKKSFKKQYIALAIAGFSVLVALLVVPNFSVGFGIPRFYFRALFILSPLFLLGGEILCHLSFKLFGQLHRLVRRSTLVAFSSNRTNHIFLLTMMIIIPYFLISSGFVFEVSGNTNYGIMDSPSSPALSSNRIYMPVFNTQESIGANWVQEYNKDKSLNDIIIYTDLNTNKLWIEFVPMSSIRTIQSSGKMAEDGYIFISTWNIKKDEFNLKVNQSIENIPMQLKLFSNNFIYNNGGAHILFCSN
jgi:uncharacterized membrane protein